MSGDKSMPEFAGNNEAVVSGPAKILQRSGSALQNINDDTSKLRYSFATLRTENASGSLNSVPTISVEQLNQPQKEKNKKDGPVCG